MQNTKSGFIQIVGLIFFIIILGFAAYYGQNLLRSTTTSILPSTTTYASQIVPTLLGSFDAVSSIDANDVTVLGNYAYLVTDNNTGVNPEFYIINIATSTQPVLVSSLNIGKPVIKITVSGNYAYLLINQDTGELVVVDISNKTTPFIASTFDIPGTINPLSIYAANSTLYIGTANNTAAQGREFYILNASSSNAVSIIGSYEIGAKVDSIVVRGERAYIGTNHNNKEITVLNIASSSAIAEIASYDLPGTSSDVNAIDYSFGKLYAVIDNFGSDPDFFVFNTTISTPLTLIGSTNLASNNSDVKIYGDRAYVSNTGTVKGFSIVDISNPASLSKISQYIAPSNAQALDLGRGNIYLATADNVKELMILDPGFTVGENIRDLNGDGVVKISALGDSNTTIYATWIPWPLSLISELGKAGVNWTILPRGIYGSTAVSSTSTQDYFHADVQLANTLVNDRPDYVVLAYGTNDIRGGYSIDSIIAAYQSLQAQAEAGGARAFIAFTPQYYPPIENYSILNNLVSQLNDRLIQTFPKENVIDFNSVVSQDDYISDGLHIGTMGQKKRANATFRKLLRTGD
ncbi:MAG: GDSL-type esterase/lipase family protein [bacterium]|nr:GDSL-type esterase/lipase family protein [bacterium]